MKKPSRFRCNVIISCCPGSALGCGRHSLSPSVSLCCLYQIKVLLKIKQSKHENRIFIWFQCKLNDPKNVKKKNEMSTQNTHVGVSKNVTSLFYTQETEIVKCGRKPFLIWGHDINCINWVGFGKCHPLATESRHRPRELFPNSRAQFNVWEQGPPGVLWVTMPKL